MSSLPAPSAPSTEAYLEAAGPQLADKCTACGACFDACPMVDYIDLRNADAREVTADLRRLARGEPGGTEVVAWVGACTKSGRCRSACPEQSVGLDAMLLIRVAKQRALNVTHQLKGKRDQSTFPRVKTFARLQLTDEELAKWL
ncbi:MAG: 4Fe-4S dicluster domain-containing protein [Hyphomicrobiaceae bacterium]